MSNRETKNVIHSVHQRILNKSRETSRPFNELLQYYTLERFLYRLSESEYGDMFILKGALLLTVWGIPESRPTKDIDLLGTTDNTIENIIRIVKKICTTMVVNDGLSFNETSAVGELIAEDAEYEGVRVHIKGNLGSIRVSLNVDIGFGDVIFPKAEVLHYSSMLGFPEPEFRGYSKESVISEKFEAMVKLGVLNSRMKDFYDIWVLSRQFDFDYYILAESISRTFTNRNTDIPLEIESIIQVIGSEPLKKKQWVGFLQKNRLDNAPKEFINVLNDIKVFLSRPLEIINKK